MSDDHQEQANRMIAEWSKDKRDFHKVRGRMGEICQTDLELMRTGRPGLGTVKDGSLDLDHAYDLARRTHPETRESIRAAERAERERRAKARRGTEEPESARDTVLRSLRELKERG